MKHRTPIIFALAVSALAAGQTPLNPSRSKTETYLRNIQSARGSVRVMFVGDSLLDGNNFDQGLRVPIALGLKLHGIEPVFVGDRTDNAANSRWFYNTFGNTTGKQTHGGVKTIEIVNGFLSGSTLLGGATASYTLTPLATALTANTPDILFVSLGTNDPTSGYGAVYAQFLSVCRAYSVDMPIVWVSPFDSNSTAEWYYSPDTGRASTRTDIRAACQRKATTGGNIVFVDSSQCLGMFTWYPIDPTGYTPASTDTAGDTVTFATDKGWWTGQEVQPNATSGGVTSGTTYYLIRQSGSGVFALATSYANAFAGTKVDITGSLNLVKFTPNGLNADNNNANAVFADSTHLQHPGWALPGAGALAGVFASSPSDELRLLCTAEPYQPMDFGDTGGDIAAGSSSVIVPGGPYKRCLTDLVVYNSDATLTATVTLYKRRVSGDGSTRAQDIAVKTFKVPAGTTAALTWPFDANPAERTCPTAWYNEGWKVAVAGANCNVRAGGKSVVY